MLKKNLICFFILIILLYDAYNQSITLIPNAKLAPYPYSYWGFNGNSIVYKGNLFFLSSFGSNIFQLVKFDGEKITLLPNPDTIHDHFDGSPGTLFIFKDNLYWQYPNSSGNYQFLKCTPEGYVKYQNPDTICKGQYTGVQGNFIEYGNKIFFVYNNCFVKDDGISHIANFDGSSIALIKNPKSDYCSWPLSEGILYKNGIYWKYLVRCKYNYLTRLVADSLELLPFPDTSMFSEISGFSDEPIIYKDNLYMELSTSNGSKLVKFNGINFSYIDDSSFKSTRLFHPVVFNDKLFFYYDQSDTLRIVCFDGQALKKIPILDQFILPEMYVFNNKLYLIYSSGTSSNLAEYDGNNLRMIPNPDTSSHKNNNGIIGSPIFFNNCLFWQYKNKNDIMQLARYDGNTLSLIENPDTSSTGYCGNPVIYNNQLYLQYLDKDYYYRVARFNETSSSIDDIIYEGFEIYPNPTFDNFVIMNKSQKSRYQLLLFDIRGTCLLNQIVIADQFNVETDNMPAGVYFLQIETEKKVIVRKVIKR